MMMLALMAKTQARTANKTQFRQQKSHLRREIFEVALRWKPELYFAGFIVLRFKKKQAFLACFSLFPHVL